MNRRQADRVRAKIEHWQHEKNDTRTVVHSTIGRLVDAELKHLRQELQQREQPMKGGRRSTDS